MKEVTIENKTFQTYISADEISKLTDEIAAQMNAFYSPFQLEIMLVGVLDGSFMFMADLVRKLTFPHSIHFVKIRSYENTQSTGLLKYMLELDVDVSGKHIVIVEDIIDTGLTIESYVEKLNKEKPLSVKTCALLSKPEVHNDIVDIAFMGKEIPPEFVIGYGMDLNGVGRHLADIYKLKV